MNAYLKEFFQLNNVRYCLSERAKIHFDMVTLDFNAAKLAVDRINSALTAQSQVAQKYMHIANFVCVDSDGTQLAQSLFDVFKNKNPKYC